MEIRKWLENLKKEKKRKKLVQAAKELEAKADPSLPKKRLPKNGVVKYYPVAEASLPTIIVLQLPRSRDGEYS